MSPQPAPRASAAMLAAVFAIAAAVALAYECTKQIVFPRIALWQSHALTIMLFAVGSTVSFHFAGKHRSRLLRETRASEQKYRRLFEASQTGVLCTTLDGRVLQYNDAAGSILGYDSAGDRIESSEVLYQTEADRTRFLEHLLAEKSLTSFELRMRRKDGSDAWVITNVQLIQPEDGGPPWIERTFLDITGRMQAEKEMRRAEEAAENANRAMEESLERLQLALDGAEEALWDWNVIENRTFYSPRWGQMLGYNAEEIGESVELWKRLLHPDDKPAVVRMLEEHMAGRAQGYEVEFRMRAKDGGWRWIRSRGKVVKRTTGGAPARVAGTHLDITERKQLADALAKARDETLAASQAKSAFLANMSHEIRTPLNAITGYAQLLMRDPALPPAARSNLSVIDRSGAHLLALIDDILDMSRIEAGRMELHPAEFDPAQLLRDLVAMYRARAEAKGLRLRVGVHALAGRVVADQGKLRQVLMNLLGNAVKFTEQGSIRVRASLRRGKDDRRWFEVSVEDTGVGISSERQRDLFRPFVQTPGDVGLRSGAGLGLAISREFVCLMGGDIAVTSQAGKGSLFRVSIPVGEAHTSNQAAAPGDHPIAAPAAGISLGDELPAELIQALKRAVVTGDKGRLDELLAGAGTIDTAVVRTLQGLADDYDYDGLTRLLEAVVPAR